MVGAERHPEDLLCSSHIAKAVLIYQWLFSEPCASQQEISASSLYEVMVRMTTPKLAFQNGKLASRPLDLFRRAFASTIPPRTMVIDIAVYHLPATADFLDDLPCRQFGKRFSRWRNPLTLPSHGTTFLWLSPQLRRAVCKMTAINNCTKTEANSQL